MMPDPCYFDDSLPRLVRVLASKLDRAQLEAGVVLRDAGGRLCFFGEREVAPEVALELGAAARAALGRYARPDRLFVGGGEAGAQRALRDPVALPVPVDLGDGEVVTVRYVDRRIVGADWLLPPSPRPAEASAPEGGAAAPPRVLRVAFSSLKGGVGRSTALMVVAAEQARRGRNVLVIDLDLEAPGIGSLLLSDDRMPGFGVIDYLLERNCGPVDPAIVSNMVGTSALPPEHGLVNVVPAIGARTLASPGNYLAKLSRAVIEALDEGAPTPLAGKLREMLAALEAQRQYDLLLIDVRAGFAEIAAGPILALDAEVLIFGTAQRQTLQDLDPARHRLRRLGARGPARPAPRHVLSTHLRRSGRSRREAPRCRSTSRTSSASRPASSARAASPRPSARSASRASAAASAAGSSRRAARTAPPGGDRRAVTEATNPTLQHIAEPGGRVAEPGVAIAEPGGVIAELGGAIAQAWRCGRRAWRRDRRAWRCDRPSMAVWSPSMAS